MIGWLKGELRGAGSGRFVVIDASGVGWAVQHSGVATAGEQVDGPVTTIWREMTGPDLWLHQNIETRDMFEALCAVRGVGATVAAAAIRAFGAEGLAGVLAAGDAGAFKPVRGVGPKMAERLIAEVKVPESITPTAHAVTVDELADALIALGFAPEAAGKALAEARTNNPDGSDGDLLAGAMLVLSTT